MDTNQETEWHDNDKWHDSLQVRRGTQELTNSAGRNMRDLERAIQRLIALGLIEEVEDGIRLRYSSVEPTALSQEQ